MDAATKERFNQIDKRIDDIRECKIDDHEKMKENFEARMTGIHASMMAIHETLLGKLDSFHEVITAKQDEQIRLQKITNSRVTHLEENDCNNKKDIQYILQQGRFVIWINKNPKKFIMILILISTVFAYVAQFVSLETILKFIK